MSAMPPGKSWAAEVRRRLPTATALLCPATAESCPSRRRSSCRDTDDELRTTDARQDAYHSSLLGCAGPAPHRHPVLAVVAGLCVLSAGTRPAHAGPTPGMAREPR